MSPLVKGEQGILVTKTRPFPINWKCYWPQQPCTCIDSPRTTERWSVGSNLLFAHEGAPTSKHITLPQWTSFQQGTTCTCRCLRLPRPLCFDTRMATQFVEGRSPIVVSLRVAFHLAISSYGHAWFSPCCGACVPGVCSVKVGSRVKVDGKGLGLVKFVGALKVCTRARCRRRRSHKSCPLQLRNI